MGSQFKRCKLCGRIFQGRVSEYCEECLRKMDEKFIKVRNYLYEYPNATVMEVVEETGVDEETILRLLEDGRLQMRDVRGMLRCEKCGRPIQGGRLCENCKRSVNSLLERSARIAEREKRAKQENRTHNGGFKSDIVRNNRGGDK